MSLTENAICFVIAILYFSKSDFLFSIFVRTIFSVGVFCGCSSGVSLILINSSLSAISNLQMLSNTIRSFTGLPLKRILLLGKLFVITHFDPVLSK